MSFVIHLVGDPVDMYWLGEGEYTFQYLGSQRFLYSEFIWDGEGSEETYFKNLHFDFRFEELGPESLAYFTYTSSVIRVIDRRTGTTLELYCFDCECQYFDQLTNHFVQPGECVDANIVYNFSGDLELRLLKSC